eukprot:gene30955-54806_t
MSGSGRRGSGGGAARRAAPAAAAAAPAAAAPAAAAPAAGAVLISQKKWNPKLLHRTQKAWEKVGKADGSLIQWALAPVADSDEGVEGKWRWQNG